MRMIRQNPRECGGEPITVFRDALAAEDRAADDFFIAAGRLVKVG